MNFQFSLYASDPLVPEYFPSRSTFHRFINRLQAPMKWQQKRQQSFMPRNCLGLNTPGNFKKQASVDKTTVKSNKTHLVGSVASEVTSAPVACFPLAANAIMSESWFHFRSKKKKSSKTMGIRPQKWCKIKSYPYPWVVTRVGNVTCCLSVIGADLRIGSMIQQSTNNFSMAATGREWQGLKSKEIKSHLGPLFIIECRK